MDILIHILVNIPGKVEKATAINIYYLVANETVDDIIWDVVQNKLENIGQFGLRDYRRTFLISSHAKNLYLMVRKLKTVRPGKQKKLDSFLKRCPTASGASPKA
ncbi:hypothetical protein HPP92_020118 [Vanilla planifolia]|uniref:Uncharacterized protein n=1 Tax=Vanilla planifolia TaxID=51239 RepID=A0A835UJZ2_VANPL|nr:hypothetical protein HPP92_020118 [Vanilla planifolia]